MTAATTRGAPLLLMVGVRAAGQGDAVIYLTVDAEGEPAHPAVHASCPVLSTTSEADYKLVLRQWVSGSLPTPTRPRGGGEGRV
eukprot:COSAG01_NODE_18736_length_1056_cov_1.319749_3_plen_84_part_00